MSPDPNKPFFWIPNADVLVTAAGELVVKVELADLTKENLELTVDGQRLTFSGRRSDPDSNGAEYLVRELSYGQFASVLDVPDEFDLSRATAAYANGILRVTAPRREPASRLGRSQ